MSEAILSHHKGPRYGQRCGNCGQYWPCDTEAAARIMHAVNELFDTGAPGSIALPEATWHTKTPWQAPGTVAVRIEVLRKLAEAAGIAE